MEHWWLNRYGYIEGRVGDRRMKQHRWVMEQSLGRTLSPHEIVHHINGNRADNRLENLEVHTRASHARHHGPPPPPSTADGLRLAAWRRDNGGPWNKGRISMTTLTCAVCGERFDRSSRDANKNAKRGYQPCCSRTCRGRIVARLRWSAAARGDA